MSWLGRFLCRHGYHSYQFIEMYGNRMVTVPPYSDYICTIIERCRREPCRIRRTRKNASIPKRVKT